MKTVPVRDFSSSSQLSGPGQHGGKRKDISSPERVIKALYNYQAQSQGELSFKKGDFFHVLRDEGEWYEAFNPMNNARGMVPKSYFEMFGRTRHDSQNAHPDGVLRVASTSSVGAMPQQPPNLGTLYAIVLYDFQAEKADELTVYAGENLFICAHHDYEWFIAKPIGRLGGPGLVPVGFVTIIDIATGYATGNGVQEDIGSVNLPTVQEWKMTIARYKASNISLGSVDQQAQSLGVLSRNSSRSFSQNQGGHSNGDGSGLDFDASIPRPDSVLVIDAAVESFYLQDDKYWFQVTCEMSDRKTRILKRYYEDFYDLQVKLLDLFPKEGGKLRDNNGQWTKRIMPYIPGPVPYVTDTITKKRKDDLNVYVKNLIALPTHISQTNLVKGLFAPKNNGFDREVNMEDTMELNIGTTSDDPTLTKNDLKLQRAMERLSINNGASKSRPPSAMAPRLTDEKPVKIKFYYKEDIFALMLHPTITFEELCKKISPRIDAEVFKLYIKKGEEIGDQVMEDSQVPLLIQEKSKIFVEDS